MERTVHRHVQLAATLLALATLLLSTPSAAAAADSLPACTRLKFHAVIRAIQASHRCEADVIRGIAVTDCRAPLFVELAAEIARADGFGFCPGGRDEVTAAVGCSPFLREGGSLRCRLAKLRAAGIAKVERVRCHRAGLKTGVPLDDCLARADARLREAVEQADRRGFCGDLFNGTFERIRDRVEQCATLTAVPLGCGNGVLDPGEDCDGQAFCRPRDCVIDLPRCCTFGFAGGAVCAATAPALELCGDFGGVLGIGFCSDIACPGDPFPGCRIGACTDLPIAPTEVCCQQGAACATSEASTQLQLREVLLACAGPGGTAALGSCDAIPRCASL